MDRVFCGLLAGTLLVLVACGDKPQENVFKGQTDALGKAEDVNRMVQEVDQVQRAAIEQQSR